VEHVRLVTGLVKFSVLVAACGGDDGGVDPIDAEAPIDGAVEPDATVVTTATLTVYADGTPIQGIDVVWSNPDGSVLAEDVTGADGSVTHEVVAGSAVTLAVTIGAPALRFAGRSLTGGGPQRFAATWLAIEPGDDLVWNFGSAPGSPLTDLEVTLPGAQTDADRYRVMVGCVATEVADPGAEIGGTIPDLCLGSDDVIDVVALAFDDDAGGAVVGYTYDTDVEVAATTSVELGAWQTALAAHAITLTDAPADIPGAGFEGHFRVDGLDYLGVSGGGGRVGDTITMTGGHLGGGIVESSQRVIFMPRGTEGAPEGLSILIAGDAGAPASSTHDLSQLLPTISDASAADAAGRLELGWSSAGSFAGADGALMLASWSDSADGSLHQRFVMAPPGASNPVVLPELPEALAAFRPSGTASFEVPTMIFIEADFFDGYDVFRERGWSIFGENATLVIPDAGGELRATLGGAPPG
jgi:hypothetical protein